MLPKYVTDEDAGPIAKAITLLANQDPKQYEDVFAALIVICRSICFDGVQYDFD